MKRLPRAALFLLLLALVRYAEPPAQEAAEAAGPYVYAAPAAGPQECTAYERYDEEGRACVFACNDEAACQATLERIEGALDGFGEVYGELVRNFREPPGEAFAGEVEVRYRIGPGERFVIEEGEENAAHRRVKRWLAAVFPDAVSDRYLSELVLYRGAAEAAPEDEDFVTYAFVEPDAAKVQWKVYVNLDALEMGEKEMVFTLIHEFFHVHSLNASQIEPGTSPEDCPTYSDGEACFREDAYMNQFFERFWKGRFDPRTEDPNVNYQKDRAAFVTEYAASNPGEDIAESFAAFILRKKPEAAASQAEAKILFFYEHPELVALRTQLRRALGAFTRTR